MNEQDMLAMYEKAGALLNGHFILSSGRHSARYLQSALVLMDLNNATELARELVKKVDASTVDMVVSPAIGGLVIGQEVARQLNKPFLFTERKEGEMQLRRGFSIPEGSRLLVVEDVITTGGSVRECMVVVREHGGVPVKVLAVVDRAPGVEGRFDVPYATALTLDVETYAADACPLCVDGGVPAIKPGSRGAA
ncbi:orotate phosphoribosyltransferase [Mariprofundus ferrooxydans]|uniref:Orotate phosphoribosyltransferase n=1 Tax=Mariprofundus ferrooxydans PV-1 TaxID=314345 RepID=Q0EY52_9PROT|nr:orotate phosphoribosyltransferase [Mariprofundus ferrooxydans]EAU54174.1 orotate phosphoribosyltransferase [Mariprofundus ferrooxydans PV-1]KON48011.1 orotate phosphoribosyltransferase [Mariprofundus ferrooxydans]